MERCSTCGGVGKIVVTLQDERQSAPCVDCSTLESIIFGGAGVPPRHSRSSFGSFTANSPALEAAKEACVSWPESDGSWLVLSGPPGVGKTHLLVAILRHASANGISGRYINLEELYSAGRAAFSGVDSATYRATVSEAMKARLVCLDEVGSGRGTEFEVGLLQEIVNHRYDHQLFTVFATNYRVGTGSDGSLEGSGKIGSHSLSRILGCSTIVEIDADDWRQS